MLIFPAIDLKDGQVVRLVKGDFSSVHQVARDPVSTAEQFYAAGARQLHMVDLDGARDGVRRNGELVRAVTGCGLRVELGGGLRTMEDLEEVFALGIWRAVIGSAAVSDPGLVRAAVERFLEMGVQNVLITLGGAGAAFGNRREFFLIPAVDGVVSVDPTGAGDSFIGAFSTFVSAGADHRAAVRMANYVGSLTVSVLGAQTSLPSLEQINRLIQERGETELLFLPEKLTRCG